MNPRSEPWLMVLVAAGLLGFLLSSSMWGEVVDAAEQTSLEELSKNPEDGSPSVSEDRPAQKAMKQLAEQCIFTVAATDKKTAVPMTLRKNPLLRYGDETRDIKDSTLWVWMNGDVPSVFQKIEVNEWPGNPSWTWCFANATSDAVRCEWRNIANGRTAQPVASSPVPGKQKTEGNETTWKFTARQINRQFTATAALEKNVLRPMPHPLLEFSAEEENIPYGAVFAYATGTNPDFLLILQLEKTADTMLWTYRPIHMTSVHVTLNHNDIQVWHEGDQKANQVSTWGYFFSPRDAAIK